MGASRRSILVGACAFGALLASCDTTAFVTLQTTRITRVSTTGAVANVCSESDNRAQFRFSLTNQRQRIVTLGDGVTADRRVVRLSADDIRPGISLFELRYFATPAVTCTSAADCSSAGLAGFSCEPVNPFSAATEAAVVPRACAFVPDLQRLTLDDRGPGEEPGLSDFNALERPKLVAVLYANGSSMLGRAPGGEVCASDVPGLPPGCVPDRANLRYNAFRQLRAELNPRERAQRPGHRMCAMAFSSSQGRGEYRFVRGDTGRRPVDGCFELVPNDAFDASSALDAYNQEVGSRTGLLQDPSFPAGDRNVWAALLRTLDEMGQSRTLEPRLRVSDVHLIVVTDGPDNGSSTSEGSDTFGTPSAVLEAVADLTTRFGRTVQIHFVHVDPQQQLVGNSGFVYRNPTGPIDDFSMVACETGGTYQYTTRIESLPALLGGVGRHINYHMQAYLRWPGVDALPPGAYQISGELRFEILDDEGNLRFGGRIDEGEDVFEDVGGDRRVDNRLMLFRRPVNDSSGGNPLPLPSEGGEGVVP